MAGPWSCDILLRIFKGHLRGSKTKRQAGGGRPWFESASSLSQPGVLALHDWTRTQSAPPGEMAPRRASGSHLGRGPPVSRLGRVLPDVPPQALATGAHVHRCLGRLGGALTGLAASVSRSPGPGCYRTHGSPAAGAGGLRKQLV